MGIRQRLSDATWTAPATAIADESQRLRLLVDSVSEYAIFLLAPDGTVMTWNPGAERLKGYCGEDIVGRHFSVFYPPEEVTAGTPQQELAYAVREGSCFADGWRLRNDGSRFWAHVVITALFDGPVLRGFAKVTHDDTATRAAVERGRAMEDITRALLSRADIAEVFAIVTRYARHIAGAGRAWLVVPSGAGFVVQAAEGELAGPEKGAVLPADWVISNVITAGEPTFADDLPTSCPDTPGLQALGAGLLVPVVAGPGITGVLIVAAPAGTSPFRSGDLELLQAFASQVELVLGYEIAQQALRNKQTRDDRERIARDLHDHVIQQLFATGIGLQSTAMRCLDSDVRARVEEAVDLLDATILQIRTTIFDLRQHNLRSQSVRAQIAAVVRVASRALAFEPGLQLAGPIDTVMDPRTCEDVLAVLREMLSNVARHANATATAASVAVADHVTVMVTDNGNGPPKVVVAGDGLRNLRARAEALNGSFELLALEDQGTMATWRIPLVATPTSTARERTPGDTIPVFAIRNT